MILGILQTIDKIAKKLKHRFSKVILEVRKRSFG